MSLLAPACVAATVVWVVLVVVAHVLNPGQSPLSMGMSGLTRGRAPWVMRSAFIVRGLTALLLAPALSAAFGFAGLALFGIVLLWVWGVGSVALSAVDTDMPGEPPTRAGAAHALIALVAYLAGVAGAMIISVNLREFAPAGVGRWALPIALAAAVALAAQLAGFWAAALQARGAAGGPSGPTSSGADVPPQLVEVSDAGPSGRGAGAAPAWVAGLDDYAGLLQRVFVGLLMLWTLLVALGV